jgi:hypothetical protein
MVSWAKIGEAKRHAKKNIIQKKRVTCFIKSVSFHNLNDSKKFPLIFIVGFGKLSRRICPEESAQPGACIGIDTAPELIVNVYKEESTSMCVRENSMHERLIGAFVDSSGGCKFFVDFSRCLAGRYGCSASDGIGAFPLMY